MPKIDVTRLEGLQEADAPDYTSGLSEYDLALEKWRESGKTTPFPGITTTTPTTTKVSTPKTIQNSFQNPDGTVTIIYTDGTIEVKGNKYVSTKNITPQGPNPSTIDYTTNREAVGKLVTDRFTKFGLGSLANKIMELARQGFTESTITLELQNSPEYQQRFSANQDRIKKGLAVLSPAEYISAEDAYRQTLRAYGLNQFDNDQYVRQFIANDVSAAELSTRVSIAVQRIQNADPAITKTLRDYYGIGTSDMLGYILDPNQALPKIQQQVAAAEIGAAARVQGLEAGVTVSEQLAKQGISQAEAQRGYATIADILPTAEKLTQIYGPDYGYGQAEAEQEVFNTLASAQRKRQKLVQREVSTFSGSAGTSRSSLGSTSGGQL